jgi:hypothetical protein
VEAAQFVARRDKKDFLRPASKEITFMFQILVTPQHFGFRIDIDILVP